MLAYPGIFRSLARSLAHRIIYIYIKLPEWRVRLGRVYIYIYIHYIHILSFGKNGQLNQGGCRKERRTETCDPYRIPPSNDKLLKSTQP